MDFALLVPLLSLGVSLQECKPQTWSDVHSRDYRWHLKVEMSHIFRSPPPLPATCHDVRAHERTSREGIRSLARSPTHSDTSSRLTEIRAAQRTFEGAYMRTALSQFSFALIILKIFTSEFYAIGALFAAYGAAIFLVAIFRRYEGNRQFFDQEESDSETDSTSSSSLSDEDDAAERLEMRRSDNGRQHHHHHRERRRRRVQTIKKRFRTSGNSVTLLTLLSFVAYITLLVLMIRLST